MPTRNTQKPPPNQTGAFLLRYFPPSVWSPNGLFHFLCANLKMASLPTLQI